MSGLYEVMLWSIYVMAAVVMLAAILSAVLAGLVLRFVAEFLREFGDGREGGAQHAEDDPSTTTRAKGASRPRDLGIRVTTSEITREIEKNGVRCSPYTDMAMPDVLEKRRWFACGEPTKEADDVLE